jgi:hypothetical protein
MYLKYEINHFLQILIHFAEYDTPLFCQYTRCMLTFVTSEARQFYPPQSVICLFAKHAHHNTFNRAPLCNPFNH